MSDKITLSHSEQNLLEEIVSSNNLEKEKKFSYVLLFFMTPISFLFFLILGIYKANIACALVLGIIFSCFIGSIGLAKFQYYKLFRIIHTIYNEKIVSK